MIKLTGKLHYDHTPEYGFRLVLEICPGIPMFYRWLIPKWFSVNGLRAKAHITVVRREKPANLKAWGKYEGEIVEYEYDPDLQTDGKLYWWLNCYSHRLEEIAEELGMAPFVNFTRPAKGYRKVWHTTVANMKSTK